MDRGAVCGSGADVWHGAIRLAATAWTRYRIPSLRTWNVGSSSQFFCRLPSCTAIRRSSFLPRPRRNRQSRRHPQRRAQRGLWREAIYRWERATQLDPTYAAAHNNLAIGYEHEGDLNKARGAYEKAMELEPSNALIKQNYELFKEINDRTTRKDVQ